MPRAVFGTILVAVGLFVMVYPFASVASVTGDALRQLPDIEADDIETDRNWTAMFSDGFMLATRTYTGVSSEQVTDILTTDGFARVSAPGGLWLTKECCGEYDAVRVRVQQGTDGRTTAVVSVFDDDIRATWPIISGLGLLVVFVGVAVARSGFRPAALVDEPERLSSRRRPQERPAGP